MKPLILFSFLLIWSTHQGYGQSKQLLIDSLFQAAQDTPDDSTRVVLMNTVVGLMTRSHTDSARSLALANIDLAKQLGFLKEEALAYLRLGITERNLGNYEAAEMANKEALRLYLQTTDSLGMADAYESLGNVYRHTGKYVQSLDYQIKCMGIRERQKAPARDIAKAYTHIANVHMSMEQFDNALLYYKKSLDLWEKEDNQEQLAISTLNYGAVLLSIKRLDEAQVHLEKSLQIFEQLGLNYGIGAAIANLGDLFIEKRALPEARQAMLKALDIYQKSGDKGRTAMFLSNLGEIEVQSDNYPLAINYYEKALDIATEIGRQATLKDTYERLSFLYEKTGQFQDAFFAEKKLSQVKDSLLSASTLQRIEEIQTRYETEKKDQEIDFLKKNEERRINERNYLLIGLGIFFLLSIITLIALRTARNANQKLSLEQKQTKALLQEKETLLEELQITQDRLIYSEKMASLGQFVAGVAHEINNPISFINSNVYALKMDFEEVKGLLEKVDELKNKDTQATTIQEIVQLSEQLNTKYLNTEIQEMVAGIERGITRTKKIIEGLLTFSHQSTEHLERADLNQSIDQTLSIVKGNLEDHIALEVDYGKLPLTYCQINRLQQVFLNILTNALQALKDQPKALIRIKTWQEGDWLKLSFKDNGPGMDETTRQKIFEPFFTTKMLGQGTGLGMAISYGIIEQHDGILEVFSEMGNGTEVVISLPYVESSASPTMS